jgi:succinylarginine dihydrolase
MFVYGRVAFDATSAAPRRYNARQTREASEAVARRHGLDPAGTVFAQQHPDAIDAGVFHNDVIAVGTGSVLFCHERAFVMQDAILRTLRDRIGAAFDAIVVRENEIGLDRAVATYLFNSQLMPREDGSILLVAAAECLEDKTVAAYLGRLTSGAGPIRELRAFDLRQSMRNGGGPACLRLRVRLTAPERQSIRANVWLDAGLHASLAAWINRHYLDRLSAADLGDPALLDEGRRALDELTQIMRLGSVYPFQRR